VLLLRTITFRIYTDANDTQLGAVITKDDNYIACYSIKLNSAQKRYTTVEQDLLPVAETLRDVCNILLG
jgi:hypothetical protein